MDTDFANLMKTINPQLEVERIQQIPRRRNKKKFTPRLIIINSVKTSDEEMHFIFHLINEISQQLFSLILSVRFIQAIVVSSIHFLFLCRVLLSLSIQ